MDMIQPFAAVLLVLALLGGTLLALRRRGMATFKIGANKARVEILERTPLTSQHALHLVRIEDRILLIATAPNCCQVLETGVPHGERL